MSIWTTRTSSSGIDRRSLMSGLAAGGTLTLLPTFSTARPARHARGARIPTNLTARIHAQNASATKLNLTIQGDRQLMRALSGSNPRLFSQRFNLPAKFDWGDRVTPVKNQGVCGSCWVFAATAAYESAYLIANKNVKPTALNVSEQEGLDCSFPDNNCITGGWHEVVLLYLQTEGEVSTDGYTPYKEEKQQCIYNMDRSFYLLNWGYVSEGAAPGSLIPSDGALKQSIFKYGPVATAVAATNGWDSYYKLDVSGRPNKDWPKNGVFVGTPNSKLKASDVNHEVLITGWDDSLGIWLVKNSWGTDWGDGGYIKLPYQNNYIGFGASWVTVAPQNSVSMSLADTLKAMNKQNSLLNFYSSLDQIR